MADDKLRNGEDKPEEKQEDFGALSGGSDDSDLGNLPPLSDFESSEGGGLDSDGGLPPISDIPVETPTPTGGNIKPPPPGYESSTPGFSTPSEGGLDTPVSDSDFDTPTQDSGTGFQDLAADSDFTPETPEIGPGPDSDIETPMFDSAFGAGDSELTSRPQTTAPTQAMETPMFGAKPADEGGAGFDADAFGAGGDQFGAAFEGGTPAPDFSPDTAAPTQPATPPPTAAVTPPPVRRKGGAMGALVSVVLIIVALAVGLLLGPKVSHDYVQTMPLNPWKSEVDTLQGQAKIKDDKIAKMQETIDGFATLPPDASGTPVSQEEIQRLIEQKRQLGADIADLEGQMGDVEQQLAKVERDLETKNEDFVLADQAYQDLLGQTTIQEARSEGLQDEVVRLTSHVGLLEEADGRRMQTKEALAHAVDLLAVTIREGIPLTPERYDHEARLASVERLRSEIDAENWVDPALLREYTALYLKELDIANSREYFYAKIPVTSRYGAPGAMWAECVMNGNWSVYYRTIDGKHLGVYSNVAEEGPPRYEFQERLPGALAKEVEETIMITRPEDYERKMQILVEKQTVADSRTHAQAIYDSL